MTAIYFSFTGINDLCGKRDELNKQIMEEEEEKQKLQNDIRILTERLSKVNESLSKKMAARNEFDKTIAETEGAYMKVRLAQSFYSCTCCNCSHRLKQRLIDIDTVIVYSKTCQQNQSLEIQVECLKRVCFLFNMQDWCERKKLKTFISLRFIMWRNITLSLIQQFCSRRL